MTMRDDVRSALERQQSALGDVGDARHRLMRDAMLNRDRPAGLGWQWAAAIAAVLIAAIVITTFALVKAGARTSTVPAATPSPKAQASPTPLADQLQVPNSTPVILYHDPANFDQLDGVTWDGKTSGRMGPGIAMGGSGNLQGTFYATSGGELRNRSGDLLAPKGFDGVFWADDGAHYCQLIRAQSSDAASPGVLYLGLFGGPLLRIAQVGTFAAPGLNAGGPTVVACSLGGDRAIVYQSGGQGVGVARFWVIQLSTGRTIWRGGSGTWIAASHDGRYVAIADEASRSAIYGDHGQLLAHVDATVFTFSWDGNVAVVASGGFGGNPAVFNWHTGQTLWVTPTDTTYKFWQAFPEPGGSHFAIGATEPRYLNTNGFQPVDLFVVDENGYQIFEKKDMTLFQY